MMGFDPRYKGYIFEREESMVYVLRFIGDAGHSKVGLELPKEVVNLSSVPHPITCWGLERICLQGGGYLP